MPRKRDPSTGNKDEKSVAAKQSGTADTLRDNGEALDLHNGFFFISFPVTKPRVQTQKRLK